MKPNILVIQTDQQSCWTLGCYGGTEIETPHIDSLAREGVRFDQFLTNSAVCTPSRGCFLTGRYPHFHGAYRNGERLGEDEITLAQVLLAHGYETGYIGKWHLDGDGPRHVPQAPYKGFEDCRYYNISHVKEVLEQPDGSLAFSRTPGDERTYTTDWLTDKTLDFLRKPRERPFFCQVSFPDPHQPFTVRAPYDTMYDPERMTIPATFYEEQLPDWADQDEWGRKRYFPLGLEDRERKLREIKAQYCGEVKCIDDNVGRLLACLRQTGQLDDTLVVFTSDHGEYMGEHGLLEKNNLYETAYRIPLLMRWPAQLKAGSAVERMVAIVDFPQTVLGLLGLPPGGREQGRDASPLLRGEPAADWVDEVYIHPSDVPRAGIFTPEYELAYVGRGWRREEGHAFRDHILFDRRRDPEQTNNLFADPAYAGVVRELTGRIVDHYRGLGSDPAILPQTLREYGPKEEERA